MLFHEKSRRCQTILQWISILGNKESATKNIIGKIPEFLKRCATREKKNPRGSNQKAHKIAMQVSIQTNKQTPQKKNHCMSLRMWNTGTERDYNSCNP